MDQIPGCHGHGQCLTPPPPIAIKLLKVSSDKGLLVIQEQFIGLLHELLSFNLDFG